LDHARDADADAFPLTYIRQLVVSRISAVDQALDRVAVVVQHEDDWVQAEFEEVCEGLHGEV
jgi:hypothetical protein